MSHHNHPDLFPNLRAVKLESFAHTWAKYFTFIKRISLYQKPVDGFDFRVKHIMFFELSEIKETDGFNERDESFIELLEGSNALKWLNTKPGDFKEVYKDTPHDNFFDEWSVVTKRPEGVVKKHSWILFSRTKIEKTTEQEISAKSKIQQLIIKAKPELEKLHRTLRKEVTFSQRVIDRENKFQEMALKRFNENSEEFELVQLEYLQDKTLFDLYRHGHEKGDFMGKLLQKILKDHGHGDYGYQKCYKIYKAALKSKTD